MDSIIRYVTNMLPYMLCSLPVILIVRYIRIKTMKKRGLKTTGLHEVGVVLFAVFLVGLASQTIIPKIEFGNTTQFIVGSGTGEINLIPFKVIKETYTAVFTDGYIEYFLINFVGNVVMFMPIGFCVPLLWRKMRFKQVVVTGALASLLIEVCQLPQARGTDIDDVWINTVGCMLGFAIFLAFKKLFPDITEKFKALYAAKDE